MMYWGNGVSGWGYALMAVSMVAFWGLVIGAIMYVARTVGRASQAPPLPDRPTAEQILAERFARGEIDDQEYQSKLATLRGNAMPAR